VYVCGAERSTVFRAARACVCAERRAVLRVCV
jgi:hypothetical protein